MNNYKNILVTRTDRLGDVLLATPVLKKLCQEYPDSKITFLVQKPWMDLLQFGKSIELMEYLPPDAAGDKRSLDALVKTLNEKKFDAALVLRDEPEVSWAIKKAGIPVRVGPYSSLRSFFTFNQGMFQRRSQCKMHEAEYNLQLADRLSGKFSQNSALLPKSWINYSFEAQTPVDVWLKEHGLVFGSYICFHPGSSGSARYLNLEQMAALIRSLHERHGLSVVLTGSAQEEKLLKDLAVKSKLPEQFLFIGKPLPQLAELYKRSLGVIAHGTGPLHLAAAVDTNVYAIFPPIFVLSEKRWGALTLKRTVWTPPVKCPAQYRCLGEKCAFFDCMSLFVIDEATKRILQWTQVNTSPS